jgi:hypothetical protein
LASLVTGNRRHITSFPLLSLPRLSLAFFLSLTEDALVLTLKERKGNSRSSLLTNPQFCDMTGWKAMKDVRSNADDGSENRYQFDLNYYGVNAAGSIIVRYFYYSNHVELGRYQEAIDALDKVCQEESSHAKWVKKCEDKGAAGTRGEEAVVDDGPAYPTSRNETVDWNAVDAEKHEGEAALDCLLWSLMERGCF